MAPTMGLEPLVRKQRITLYNETHAPAIARFDIELKRGEDLPTLFTWGGTLYLELAPNAETYFRVWPVKIDIHTRPADPEPREAVLMLKPKTD